MGSMGKVRSSCLLVLSECQSLACAHSCDFPPLPGEYHFHSCFSTGEPRLKEATPGPLRASDVRLHSYTLSFCRTLGGAGSHRCPGTCPHPKDHLHPSWCLGLCLTPFLCPSVSGSQEAARGMGKALLLPQDRECMHSVSSVVGDTQ